MSDSIFPDLKELRERVRVTELALEKIARMQAIERDYNRYVPAIAINIARFALERSRSLSTPQDSAEQA